jgi:AraC family transcriptional regulator of adaptative response / DNA-3-methyladenine glycosylase II
VELDADTCYRALVARDERFDGLFFVGVVTTGVYCRPICPARTPGQPRCSFYRHAAQAERAGFRACLRCRPELAPGASRVDARSRLVREAAALVESDFLGGHSVDALAARLGVSSRQLRRAMLAEIGVTPIELAQSRRLALAKQLLQDTSLPITEVAFASGFASVRRFNALVRERFGRAPSELRRHGARADDRGVVRLRLGARPPFDGASLLRFFGARSVPGVEKVGEHGLVRAARDGDRVGWIAVTLDAAASGVEVSIAPALAGSTLAIAARVRRQFDLDAMPEAIAKVFCGDPLLAPRVRARPGLRVPGAFDPFEAAVRAVLGQQVTVRAATTLAGRVAARFGTPIATPHEGVDRLFPRAPELAAVSPEEFAGIGMPLARGRALQGLADAVARGLVSLEPDADPDETIAALEALPGIGPWTARYVAMRALGWPDVFLGGDLMVKKALGGVTQRAADRRAEAWRPWRAYAVVHLWAGPVEGDA